MSAAPTREDGPAEIFMRYGAVDVYYPPSGGARAALVVATDPAFATVVDKRVAWLAQVALYEPGAFFRRELPATRAVLDSVKGDLDLLIVDGYVDLDPAGRVWVPDCRTR
jgi:deoxyribonuclease V